MKILTVRHPWAWLIVEGHKDVENRTWAAKYRGPLLIQASLKRPTPYNWECAKAFAAERGVKIPAMDDLKFGGIVGIANLLDCVRSHSSPWYEGDVGWVLRDARPLPFVPCSGRLYLFDAPEEVISRLPAGAVLR